MRLIVLAAIVLLIGFVVYLYRHGIPTKTGYLLLSTEDKAKVKETALNYLAICLFVWLVVAGILASSFIN
jgi:hypothetical protein